MAEKPEDAKFGKALENWPELRDRLERAELTSRERGAISSMHTLRRVTSGNVALVGDASGSVDPITGEGLRLSFHQALALAEAMQSDNLQKYESAHRELARRPTRMANLMLLLDRNPWVRERAIRALAAKPDLLRSFLAIHSGAATPAQTISAGVQLSWQFLAV
jgi:flavin-dependent dehydrogenase